MPLLPPSLTLPRIVPYQFPTRPPAGGLIALVGEAPGAEEDKNGRPFCGRSGQLLDKVLASVGIDRAACLVANSFRLRPPANKVSHFFIPARTAAAEGVEIAKDYGKFGSIGYCRAEYAPEIQALRDTLLAQKPAVIVALGATALWALTGEGGILSKRGIPLPCRLAPSIPVIPTFHPSYILRGNFGMEPIWASDLTTALETASKQSKGC
jgi:uracil-DNA glycosylase